LKRKSITQKTPKGRILQGEKGIGRFAIFKLGKTIKIASRKQLTDDKGVPLDKGESIENILIYDFSQYDEEFLRENGEERELFLDDLKVEFIQQKPTFITVKTIELGNIRKERDPYGTIIEISNLKTNWTEARVKRIQSEIGKMQPIFSTEESTDFHVWVYRNDKVHPSQDLYKQKLINCMERKPVFKITDGKYSENDKIISFKSNSQDKILRFTDSEVKGLSPFKDYFKTEDYKTECGDFGFEFYIFDLDAESDTKYALDREEKKIIKEHRIYLYRDDIRVLPYGDPDDDWLKIDMARGTISAGEFLSNDQVVGCIYITQRGNPKLKDKTNREGLIEEGKALEDFINILQLVLKYLRKIVYQKYLIDKKRRKEIDNLKKGKPLELIESAKKQSGIDEKNLGFLNNFERSYKQEQKILQERIRKTESLAAVGLSIETASHDVMLFLKKTLEQLDATIRDLMIDGDVNKDIILNQLTLLRGNMSMIETQMKDIQLLFPSTKSKTKNIDVNEIIEKVYRLYKRPFSENKIKFIINATKTPLIVKTTDAVLLQVFINLFDNSFYWLKTVSYQRKIEIYIDGNGQRIIFSDNGPGIKEEAANYIFEAFYSGKGEEGRGLGLYIARQLLDRYDYTIGLAEFSDDKRLKGANFVLEFIKEG
ncbi:MAG: HAMP domain-containing sensor histidine kinase, partial [Clostridia bacterium]|nr:HAMP domain-containing sensor histidine kinase [Clostridia bacterium]